MFQRAIFSIFLFTSSLIMASSTAAKSLKIVTDLKPVNAIVATITGDTHAPVHLINSEISAHDFALKPSDIRKLQSADLIVWLGPEGTPALAKLLAQPEFATKAIALNNLTGVVLLENREPGVLHGHKHGHEIDPHTWLEPDNAVLWSKVIAERLQRLDPENAEKYVANQDTFAKQMSELKLKIKTKLSAEHPLPYVQLHDAFQYFETAFGLNPKGIGSSGEHSGPSLGILNKLRSELAQYSASCIFVSNTQHGTAHILTEVSGAKTTELDPIGAAADQNYSYQSLLETVADDFATCLFRPS